MAGAFKNVAIIGGGPGGLVLANLIDSFPKNFVRTTLFEASPRLGGKVLTRSFASAGAHFEAGVAELYDYSHLGADPLKDLVIGLGLETIPMTSGRTVILNDKIVTDSASLKRHFGKEVEARFPNFIDPAQSFIRRMTITWRTGGSTKSIRGPIGCFPTCLTTSRIRRRGNMLPYLPAATLRQNRI